MKNNYLVVGLLSLALLGSINAAEENSEMVNVSCKVEKWRLVSNEITATNAKDGNDEVLQFKVKINHKLDAKGRPDGKYLKGWPRALYFLKPPMDFRKFKYLRFDYKVSSNRKNMTKIPFYVNFCSGKNKCDYHFELGPKDGEWHEIKVLLSDVIKKSHKDASEWAEVIYMQFCIAESKYADGDELSIKLKNIFFIK